MRFTLRAFVLLTSLALVAAVNLGCNPKKDAADDQAGDHDHAHSDHGHDHDHAHDGGHTLALATPDGQKAGNVEWMHDDAEGTVTVLLRESNGQPFESPPDEVVIEVRAGRAPQTYTLPATDTVNGAPAKAAYSLTDPALVTALQVIVEGQEPILRVGRPGANFEAIFLPHDHDHDHDHDHAHE
jgi:hypothetical protein